MGQVGTTHGYGIIKWFAQQWSVLEESRDSDAPRQSEFT